MVDDTEANRWWVGVLAVAVVVGSGYLIYRQSQPNTGNLPPLNMSREELMRGAMVDGPGAAAPQTQAPNEPSTVTPKKGGLPRP